MLKLPISMMPMAVSHTHNKAFEVFLSYEPEFEMKVLRLYNTLVDKYEVEVWLDQMEIRPGDDIFNKTTEAIKSTKLMICCVTKAYPNSSKGKNDITMAYTNDKPILLLLAENVPATDFSSISFALENAQRFNLFESVNPTQMFHGEQFDKVLQGIENILERKLFNRKSRKSVRKFSTNPTTEDNVGFRKVSRVKFPTVAISNAIHSLEAGTKVQLTTITTEEVIIDKSSVHFKAYEDHLAQLHNREIAHLPLKKLRSTALFQTMYGFNRMVLLENRSRFFLTSSYNQYIVMLDINGNWLERKNPNGVLRAPWGICYNGKAEVYVGDNEAKCIFVFDYNLKFIRKICDNISSGLFDLAYDVDTNEIIIANLFDSQIRVVDERTGRLQKKVFIPSPTYLRLAANQLIVLSTDYIFCLDKAKYDVVHTIKLYNSEYIFGLHIDSQFNIYTTVHEVDEDNNKSREIYLYIIRASDKFILKRVHVPLTQVNDMIPYNGHFFFLSDTHLDIFDYDGFQ